jgi:hypothetical protein
MGSGLRKFIESILFAGLKPGGAPAASPRRRWLGPLAGPLERFLSGGPPPSDPLYLSRRTPKQRFMVAAKVALPILLVAAAASWIFRSSIFPKNPPKLDLTAPEIAAKMLPDLDKIKIDTNRDVEVPSVGFDRAGQIALVGTVRNNTSHTIDHVEIQFEVTDENGSKLGGITASVQKLPPKSDSRFRVPIEQKNAAIALVRAINTQ